MINSDSFMAFTYAFISEFGLRFVSANLCLGFLNYSGFIKKI